MNQDLYQEALRLYSDGMTIAAAARAVGVTPNALGGAMFRRGDKVGHRTAYNCFPDEQRNVAIERNRAGESWEKIAKSYGMSRNALAKRIYAGDRKIEDAASPRVIGAGLAGRTDIWQKRKVRQVIKPPAEVNKLARLFAAGKISRTEFCSRIGPSE